MKNKDCVMYWINDVKADSNRDFFKSDHVSLEEQGMYDVLN